MVCCSWVDGIIFIVCPHSSELPLQTRHSNITCVILTIFGDAEENVFIELCCSANAKNKIRRLQIKCCSCNFIILWVRFAQKWHKKKRYIKQIIINSNFCTFRLQSCPSIKLPNLINSFSTSFSTSFGLCWKLKD